MLESNWSILILHIIIPILHSCVAPKYVNRLSVELYGGNGTDQVPIYCCGNYYSKSVMASIYK